MTGQDDHWTMTSCTVTFIELKFYLTWNISGKISLKESAICSPSFSVFNYHVNFFMPVQASAFIFWVGDSGVSMCVLLCIWLQQSNNKQIVMQLNGKSLVRHDGFCPMRLFTARYATPHSVDLAFFSTIIGTSCWCCWIPKYYPGGWLIVNLYILETAFQIEPAQNLKQKCTYSGVKKFMPPYWFLFLHTRVTLEWFRS